MSVPDRVREAITLRRGEIDALLDRRERNPFRILGRRLAFFERREWLVFRGVFPTASQVDLIDAEGQGIPQTMTRLWESPVFEWMEEECSAFSAYQHRITEPSGHVWTRWDPYAFGPFLSGYDLYLFGQGNLEQLYERLGAHPMSVGEVSGILFAVWAPNALGVSVVGDFNQWDGRCHPMRSHGPLGVWELFVPGLVPGDAYKFELRQSHGRLCQKSDPLAMASELRPKTASIVTGVFGATWGDQAWMEERSGRDWRSEPVSIYEAHAPSWARVPEDGHRMLTYEELAAQLVPYVKEMGFTHIELLPVMDHPLDDSWGYQTVGYYSPTRRHGSPSQFASFVEACHREGLGLILDWVPGHFPKDDHGLARFDGTSLYEHADPRRGDQPDWGTLVFNHGRLEVSNFLISNALYWFSQYHVDGLRVDAVASMLYSDYSRRDGEWVPNVHGGRENLESVAFLERLNGLCHARFPGVMTIAEESTSWPRVTHPVRDGGLGFDLKWNLGWMHDVLDFLAMDPIYRKHHLGRLTFQIWYAFSEAFALVLSHDEVVHGKSSLLGKMSGDASQKFANLRLLYAMMYAFPGKKLLFMGSELAPWNEWRHDESLPWHLLDYGPHRGIQSLVRDLNGIYRSEAGLHKKDHDPRGFMWTDFSDVDNTVLSFIRRAEGVGRPVLCAFNCTPIPRFRYRLGVPFRASYREILNTDSMFYGGGNLGNAGLVASQPVPCHGFSHSIELTLPPLGALYLVPEVP